MEFIFSKLVFGKVKNGSRTLSAAKRVKNTRQAALNSGTTQANIYESTSTGHAIANVTFCFQGAPTVQAYAAG
jgi:hypothetical protein